ncbi:MoaD/ThiS family protein [Cytobacillus sp. IB215665]|uniref:MoaD/ThiS family protein n=1 Tax=Cytobacillus sp. IB215665 TaxID=3097357 RepID=UPI002A123DD1|nr:MoaD/ThiS family protein [Cytobacillus sp. IB215665]MDX8367011.1 MoaD/ThiS family protein [Cytobacillus sp. IB215665]
MSVQITFSGSLVNQSTPEVWNVLEEEFESVILLLKKEKPSLYKKIIDSNGNFRSFVGVYLNGTQLEGHFKDIKLRQNDEVLFIGSVAGG